MNVDKNLPESNIRMEFGVPWLGVLKVRSYRVVHHYQKGVVSLVVVGIHEGVHLTSLLKDLEKRKGHS